MALTSLMLDKTIVITIANLLSCSIAKCINLAANDSRYDGPAKKIIVTYIYTLFLKEAHSAKSKTDDSSWPVATLLTNIVKQ